MLQMETMKNPGKTAAKQQSATAHAVQHYLWVAVLYAALTFLLPASNLTRHEYHLSAFEYHILAFAVALPTLMVWLAAFIGYAQVREYARSVRKTPEGIYFDQLADGVTWLAWSLPIGTIIPAVLNGIANRHPGFHAASIILSNYLGLALALVAFSVIAGASRGLLGSVRVRLSLVNARLIIAGFLLLGVLYCFFTFRRLDLSSLGSSNNPYFLPVWLMVVSVIVPYLYAWFMGILASFELTLFSRHTRGVLYRQPLTMLVGGLLTVIFSSVLLQYISSVDPRVGYLIFNYKLALALFFRLIGGGGFVLMAVGAGRLRKIEEV
ncbi:MAG TPA: hypothetical protein VHA37_09710 [Candidatus Saccharimonadales bacterium]|nr:hypothetical protein [Candidatus Saccharimonadales bacterium]